MSVIVDVEMSLENRVWRDSRLAFVIHEHQADTKVERHSFVAMFCFRTESNAKYELSNYFKKQELKTSLKPHDADAMR